MNEDNRKILFSGLGEKTKADIKRHLDNSEFESEFCNFHDTENFIEKFHPVLIVSAISSSLTDYKNQISQLKIISKLYGINLAVLVNWSEENPYIFLVNNGITKIITSPVLKPDFSAFLKRFLAFNKHDEKTDNSEINSEINKVWKGSCSETEKFLISNLVIQNRMLKDTLKKNKNSGGFEKNLFNKKIEKNRLFEQKLWDALENNYYKLYYQPVISLDTEKLSGFEALIRLIHPEEGLITPDVFIPIAENSAVIYPLGLWIIEEACRQIVIWKEKYLLDTPLRINVNLSAKQFIHPELISHIFEITEKYSIDENDIAFELTESAFMEDMESANMALLELKSKKFIIYMDDFGTGYSSLSYLMHFPVNVIKIDQSFVKWMHIDEQSEILVRSIIALAKNLGLKVVAEGTDDKSQIDILKECGCHYAQGYYYSKPLCAEEATVFIASYFNEN